MRVLSVKRRLRRIEETLANVKRGRLVVLKRGDVYYGQLGRQYTERELEDIKARGWELCIVEIVTEQAQW